MNETDSTRLVTPEIQKLITENLRGTSWNHKKNLLWMINAFMGICV